MGGIVDVFKGITGIGETKAEKQAKAAQAQQQSILSAQAEQERKRASKKAERLAAGGRMSLLSGSELGVQEQPLQKTLG